MTKKDIFEALEADHQSQRTLVSIIGKTEGDSGGRRELFGRLVRELRSHAKAEERTLYSVMLGEKESQDETAHSVHEHELMEGLISELLETDLSSPGWIATFRKLAERVEHHLDEEETKTFDVGRSLLTNEHAMELGEKFERHKAAELEERPADIESQA